MHHVRTERLVRLVLWVVVCTGADWLFGRLGAVLVLGLAAVSIGAAVAVRYRWGGAATGAAPARGKAWTVEHMYD